MPDVEAIVGWVVPALVVFGVAAIAVAVIMWAVRQSRRSPRARASAEAVRAEAGVLLVRLDDAIEQMVDPTSTTQTELLGIFDLRTETLNKLNKDIDAQIDGLEFNLDQIEETLVQKFAALEELMAGLNAQGAYLSAQLGSVGSFL